MSFDISLFYFFHEFNINDDRLLLKTCFEKCMIYPMPEIRPISDMAGVNVKID